MTFLNWISENQNFILDIVKIIVPIIVIYLKMERDKRKAAQALRKQRADDELERKNEKALEDKKRLAHEQKMATQQANENKANREFYQNTLTDQRNQITSLESSRDELQDSVAELTTQDAKKDRVIANMQDKINSLQSNIDSLRRDVAIAEKKYDDAMLENRRLAGKFNQERATNKQLEKLNSEYAMQMADMRKEIEESQKQIVDLQAQIKVNIMTIQRLTEKEDTTPLPELDSNGNEVTNVVQLLDGDNQNENK